MNLEINLYIDNEEETQIDTFKCTSDPFEIGQTYHLSVKELSTNDFVYNTKGDKVISDIHKDLDLKFRLKSIKIIKDYRHILINSRGESEVTIDYYCKFIDDSKKNTFNPRYPQ